MARKDSESRTKNDMYLGEVQGSDWGGSQTGVIRKVAFDHYGLESHGNGSMDYEAMQRKINSSDSKKLHRTMKHTADSGY